MDDPPLRIPVRVDSTTGLRQDSSVTIDKLTTVRRSDVQERVGRVPAAPLVHVERSLVVFLGLVDRSPTGW